MNELLTGLGVSPEVQHFFKIRDRLLFSYGDDLEHYGIGFHKVPVSRNIWLAGMETATQVVVTHSAMEAIALLSIKRPHYPALGGLAFVAIGARLHRQQIEWIRNTFATRHFTLAFGNDLLGRLTAIKFAAGMKRMELELSYEGELIHLRNTIKQVTMNAAELSLHTFQEAFNVRPRLRTVSPRAALTYLDQLQNTIKSSQ